MASLEMHNKFQAPAPDHQFAVPQPQPKHVSVKQPVKVAEEGNQLNQGNGGAVANQVPPIVEPIPLPIHVDDQRILTPRRVLEENRKQWQYLLESGMMRPRNITKEEVEQALHDWLDANPDTSYTREDLEGVEIIDILNKTATSEIIEKRWSVIRNMNEFIIDREFPIPFFDHDVPSVAYEANTIVCPRCGPIMNMDPYLEPFCRDCGNHRTVWMIKLATHDKDSYIEEQILSERAEEQEQQETRDFIGKEITHENVLYLYQKQHDHYAFNHCIDMQTTISKTSYHKIIARMSDGDETSFILFGDEQERYVLPDP